MRWPRWLRIPINGHAAELREQAEKGLDEARRARPAVRRAAQRLQDLPPEELAERLRNAMTLRGRPT